MPKAVRIGAWLTVVSMALLAQGCWEDQQDKLTLLGEGGCRTADGGEGDYANVAAASAAECEAQCFAGEKPCTAVEFNGNNNDCEIHHQPITTFKQFDGVSCYVVNRSFAAR
jgi:hypothetical protein